MLLENGAASIEEERVLMNRKFITEKQGKLVVRSVPVCFLIIEFVLETGHRNTRVFPNFQLLLCWKIGTYQLFIS